MSNYNSQLQSNNTDLQAILNTINELPEAGGTEATPVISINSANGLITATAGAKTSNHQLAFQAAKTITPSTASQIAVSSGYYTGGNVTVAAVPTQSKTVTPTSTTQNITPDSGKFLSQVTVNGDSDLVAGNIKSGVNIFGVTGTYEGSGGNTSVEDSIITRSISGSYANDRLTSIGDYAFAYCSSLTTVSFPACTTIGHTAFAYCSSLTTVSFPACTTIGNSAFRNCSSLTSVSFSKCTTIGNTAFASCSKLISVSFPACTSIGNTAFASCSSLTTVSFPVCTTILNYAFASCSKLISVSFPVCTTIPNYAFASCSKLISVSFPACTSISDYAFAYCPSLTTVSFPVCTTILNYAFASCSKLISVSFPVCTTISDYAFQFCTSLTSVSFPSCTIIDYYAFRSCYNLKSLYLTGSSLCKLSYSNAFSSTPIGGYSKSAGTYGSIYVPASLLASYKAATNWTYFSSRFVGI